LVIIGNTDDTDDRESKVYYRVLESLYLRKTSERIPAGTVSQLRSIPDESIKLLLAKHRIAEVAAPPLAILPGWEEKAKKYNEQGIETINDFKDFDDLPIPAVDLEDAMQYVGSFGLS